MHEQKTREFCEKDPTVFDEWQNTARLPHMRSVVPNRGIQSIHLEKVLDNMPIHDAHTQLWVAWVPGKLMGLVRSSDQ